jgi:hypothetical protein
MARCHNYELHHYGIPNVNYLITCRSFNDTRETDYAPLYLDYSRIMIPNLYRHTLLFDCFYRLSGFTNLMTNSGLGLDLYTLLTDLLVFLHRPAWRLWFVSGISCLSLVFALSHWPFMVLFRFGTLARRNWFTCCWSLLTCGKMHTTGVYCILRWIENDGISVWVFSSALSHWEEGNIFAVTWD